MRIQPLINKDKILKNKIYEVYNKYVDGSISIELENKLIVLKSGEFKFLK